jgi:hypothetical protein
MMWLSLVAIPVGAMLFRRIATVAGKLTCRFAGWPAQRRLRHGMTSCAALVDEHESNDSGSAPGPRYRRAQVASASRSSCFEPFSVPYLGHRGAFEESVNASHRVPGTRAENVCGSALSPVEQPRPKKSSAPCREEALAAHHSCRMTYTKGQLYTDFVHLSIAA